MILYLDTSSLVKLYIEEDGSAEVRRLVDDAAVVATSLVAFAEARSAFARLAREEVLTDEQLARVRSALIQDWDSFLKVRVLKRVYESAGGLAEDHALRGFDALHLASFVELLAQSRGERVEFSAFDGQLNAAAEAVRAERDEEPTAR